MKGLTVSQGSGSVERPRFAAASAGRVRALRPGDLPAVLDLYGRVFPRRGGMTSDETRAYLETIFCRHPWRDETIASLVFEGGHGAIAGCLGVMPRPMLLAGRPVRAAITHTFMVEPGSRAALAGMELARTFLDGGQDLSIAEGSQASRRILERFGGRTVLLYSLRWTRPLRPARHLLALLRRRGLPSPVSRALVPFCAVADRLAPLIPERSLRLAAPRLQGGPLDASTLLDALTGLTRGAALRPVYDRASLQWLLDLLARKRVLGEVRGSIVREPSGELAGWYVYFLNRGGIGEVVQVGARRDAMPEVLDRLFHDARQGGAAAVSGQLDPAAFQALSERGCVFHHDGGSWFLVHSRNPAALDAFQAGQAFLTRLEGEWCVAL